MLYSSSGSHSSESVSESVSKGGWSDPNPEKRLEALVAQRCRVVTSLEFSPAGSVPTDAVTCSKIISAKTRHCSGGGQTRRRRVSKVEPLCSSESVDSGPSGDRRRGAGGSGGASLELVEELCLVL